MGKKRGFTLIELMVTVAILGILAAIAIPTFVGFVARSKTAEATGNLNSMFKNAASYYYGGRAGKGVTSLVSSHCTVPSAPPEPATPGMSKVKFNPAPDSSFRSIGFSIGDFVYYSYEMVSESPGCDQDPNTLNLYTLMATGDLDGDGTESVFELAAGSDSDNLLYHSRAIYIENEIE